MAVCSATSVGVPFERSLNSTVLVATGMCWTLTMGGCANCHFFGALPLVC